MLRFCLYVLGEVVSLLLNVASVFMARTAPVLSEPLRDTITAPLCSGSETLELSLLSLYLRNWNSTALIQSLIE